MRSLFRRGRSERGAALLEMALTLPLLLLVCVGILEFGRAYQTWQVLTNAAREGARIAVLPGTTTADIENRVQTYLTAGQLPNAGGASVVIDKNVSISIGTGTATASQITVNYPFDFVVLDPIAKLATGQGDGVASTLNMAASATMRNEM
jgi:Flp pilus assembly protein TadG